MQYTSKFYLLLTVAHLPHPLHPDRRGGLGGGRAGEARRDDRLLAAGRRVRRDLASLHAEALQVGKCLADGAEGEELGVVGVVDDCRAECLVRALRPLALSLIIFHNPSAEKCQEGGIERTYHF